MTYIYTVNVNDRSAPTQYITAQIEGYVSGIGD